MPRIYISHASDDYDVSKNLADCLKENGAEIWIHYAKLEHNGDLPNVLKRAIDCCDAFLLVWSKWALHSQCVKLECQTALKFKKTIIPCLFDDTKQSVLISNFQCINFNNFEQGYEDLLAAVNMKKGETDNNIFSTNQNQIIKPVLISPIFRYKPKKLSEEDVKEMLKRNDFFEKNRNKTGNDFNNQFELKEISHNKIILDYTSRLIWQQDGSSEPMPFKQAKFWTEELNRIDYANYHDWRLPTLEEAMSLMKKEQRNGELFIDPIFNDTQKWIWTSDSTQNE
ncbi:MAG: TIR domain-containing protein, partial [bacterium]